MNQTPDKSAYVFPDYDPDIMNSSDANAILSHFEETYPIHYHWMQKNDLLLSCLFPHVNYYMEQIVAYVKKGYRLHSAREQSFTDTTSLMKDEFLNMDINESDTPITTPSDVFDLDKNTYIDSETL